MLFTFYLVDKMTNRKLVKKHLEFEEAQDLYYDAVAVYLDIDRFTSEKEYDNETYEAEDRMDGEMRGRFGDHIHDVIGGYFAEDDLEEYFTKMYKL